MKRLVVLFFITFLLSGVNAHELVDIESTPLLVTNLSQKVVLKENSNEIVVEDKTYKEVIIQEQTPIAALKEGQINNNINPLLLGMQGNAGRIVLPDVGYEMPLYTGPESSWISIVDSINSALYVVLDVNLM